MTGLDIGLGLAAATAVVGGLLAVTTRRVVHAALWLVVALLGVAASAMLLGAEIVSLVLVLVYIGAVVVLVLFALMLTRAPIGPDTDHEPTGSRRAVAAVAGLATTGLLLAVLLPVSSGTAERAVRPTEQIAAQIFGTWVWPFEALSLLLLAALVAALAVSRIPKATDGGDA